MALSKCKECGYERSDKAVACPKCGAKITRTSTGVKLLAIFFGIVLINMIYMSGNKQSATAESQSTDSESKAQKEADLKRYSAAVAAASAIKSAMRDPESLKFESMRVNTDATIICSEYRAKNGFGGMNREFIVFLKGTANKTPAAWNKNCREKMYDQLYAVD